MDQNIYIIRGEETNFEKTIRNNVNIGNLYSKKLINDTEYQELKEIYPDTEMKCWGVQNNTTKDKVWDKMKEGELCLMYLNNKIIRSGLITYKFHNEEVAQDIWKNSENPFEYIFCLKDMHKLNIPSNKIFEKEFDYEPDYNPRGSHAIAKKRVKNVIDKYGSIENFRKKFEEKYNSSRVKESSPDNEIRDNRNMEEVIDEINNYIKSQGYTYPDGLIKNFYLSLKTKPFVLLAGISGTGKTKLAQLFAEAIGCISENDQFKLISVKPNWNDSSDLIGYTNIKGKFKPGPLVDIIKKATKHPDKPHIVLLDEMNLARVEYYFSDFLSKMETRRFRDGRIITDNLLSDNDFEKSEDKEKYANISIPDNIYFIGTVNMDETTHPFSKKVLDRANTIEFNKIELLEYNKNIGDQESPNIQYKENDFLKTRFLKLRDTLPEYDDLVNDVTHKIEDINNILKKANLHVGYRIRDEINFYVIEAVDKGILDQTVAFDNQIMQKILPRIQGSSRRIKKVLIELYKFTTGKDYTNENGRIGDELVGYCEKNKDNIRYPASSQKIANMVRRYEEDGFTAYWI